MNPQQLHIVRETAKLGFSLTAVAHSMAISQPAVSRHLRELEQELGVPLFSRHGKRLSGLTPVGQQLLPIANRMLDDMHHIRQLATRFTDKSDGSLRIASEHFLACHQLPHVIKKFRAHYPRVQIDLRQGSEQDLFKQLREEQIDLLVSTSLRRDDETPEFIVCGKLPSKILVRHDHPLVRLAQITLPQLAAFPLMTYPVGTQYRMQLDQQFKAQGLRPTIALSTHDADSIYHYVEQDLGVGIIPGVIIGSAPHDGLQILDASHLFADGEIGVSFNRNLLLHGYVRAFLDLCRSELNHFLIASAQERLPVVLPQSRGEWHSQTTG